VTPRAPCALRRSRDPYTTPATASDSSKIGEATTASSPIRLCPMFASSNRSKNVRRWFSTCRTIRLL